MGFMKPSKPRGPSPDELSRREKASRDAETERLKQQKAAADSEREQEASAKLADREATRRRFAGKLQQSADEPDDSRRRFLKGA